MGIGTGIFLFVVGAILAFALNLEVSWINVDLVGYILMGAGFIVFAISLAFTLRHRASTTETRTSVDPASGQKITRSNHSDTI